ncbi:unnamed protein product [Rotaria magnacalcarata]|uniref:Uncharacterized protein n=1 Tax=Rotaria magnacalcarata TaxID=392030 RepID=A0A820FUA2_9BILA|nr:unnamed protein product [Rotaria magnacalcarata]CAF4266614.1 unnamed protein product [Rotaria magnacalcarata]
MPMFVWTYATCALSSFINGGFESGNYLGWTRGGGTRTSLLSSQIKPQEFLPGGSFYNPSIASTQSSIVTNGLDPILKNLMANIVQNGTRSLQIGDAARTGDLSVASQSISNYFCDNMFFAWLAVFEDGNHTSEESSLIVVELKDLTQGDTPINKTYTASSATAGVDPGFQSATVLSRKYYYTPGWRVENLNLGVNRRGHNFSLSIAVADCFQRGHLGYVYLDSFGGIVP